MEKVLKHDFHAATIVYGRQSETGSESSSPKASDTGLPTRLICKINRRTHFCFIPLSLIGRLMTHNEVYNLRRCEGIHGVPRVLARIHPNMYVYGYIEGTSLGEKPPLPADFFDNVLAVLRQIHERNLVHFDLHKLGNILIGNDGRPYIIDFQISTHIGDRFLLSRRLSSRLRRRLQAYDRYHIYKHKRRLQPELLTAAEERLSRDDSLPVRVHRAIVKPYRRVRRTCLRYMYAKGILTRLEDGSTCPETDPVRWTGK